MISAVVFDLDGLLADTEGLHSGAWRTALAEVGVVVTEEEYSEHWIRGGQGIAEYVERRGLAVRLDEVRRRKADVYRALVESFACAMPGAVELVRALHGRKRLALATSSYRESVDMVFARIDVERYFEVVATYESAPRRKPYPDVYLHVAERLGLPPGECLALDDAEKGIVAAHAAGMRSIAVPTRETRDNDFSRATLVVPSLSAISLELIDSLAG